MRDNVKSPQIKTQVYIKSKQTTGHLDIKNKSPINGILNKCQRKCGTIDILSVCDEANLDTLVNDKMAQSPQNAFLI